METHHKGLIGIDKEFGIDIAWFGAAVGAKGQSAVESHWLKQLFPAGSQNNTLEKAFEVSKKFQTTDCYLFATSGAKSAIQGGHSIIKTMLDGSPPPVDASTSSFTNGLMARLPTLVTRSVKIKTESEGKNKEEHKVVTGREALAIIWAEVKTKHEKGAVKLEELKDLMRFRHLLDEDVAEEVMGISSDLYKKVNKRKLPLGDLPKDAELKGKKPKKAAKPATSEADDLARQLLAM
eukprot:6454844-Amphidinium_carterae.2